MLLAIIILLSILSLFLILLKLIFKKTFFLKIMYGLWIIPFVLLLFMILINPFVTKMQLDKDEIYGNYVIDREKCAVKQADWQYNHYRFKITEDNKIHFYITENEKVVKTIMGMIKINEGGASPHLKIFFDKKKFTLPMIILLYTEIFGIFIMSFIPINIKMFFSKKVFGNQFTIQYLNLNS
jgi:hypothetical protein